MNEKTKYEIVYRPLLEDGTLGKVKKLKGTCSNMDIWNNNGLGDSVSQIVINQRKESGKKVYRDTERYYGQIISTKESSVYEKVDYPNSPDTCKSSG